MNSTSEPRRALDRWLLWCCAAVLLVAGGLFAWATWWPIPSDDLRHLPDAEAVAALSQRVVARQGAQAWSLMLGAVACGCAAFVILRRWRQETPPE
ncbi:MAG: calcium uniporter family protein [Pirellulales bacterium]|nr:calcium uniporter family protein [Pirellulales bacterium]